jgi:hypothetical protein
MTDIAERLNEYATGNWLHEDLSDLLMDAADEIERLRAKDQHWNEHLRTAQAEIKRLTACLKWEQNWLERVGTHSPGCWQWGPGHYMCAVRHIEEMERD